MADQADSLAYAAAVRTAHMPWLMETYGKCGSSVERLENGRPVIIVHVQDPTRYQPTALDGVELVFRGDVATFQQAETQQAEGKSDG